jgi:hypothetical protein
MKPPFELYRECDIADADGHICTAENKEIAAAILAVLNHAAEAAAFLDALADRLVRDDLLQIDHAAADCRAMAAKLRK